MPLKDSDNILQPLKNLKDKYVFISEREGSLKDINYYNIEDVSNQERYIIILEKIFKTTHSIFTEEIIKVLIKLSEINNPYLLRYITNGKEQILVKDKPPKIIPYIIFEYAYESNLFDYLAIKPFSEIQSKLIFYKILKGIKAIHDLNICHRYIRPQNILFDRDCNPKIFGFNYLCQNTKYIGQVSLDEKYCASELLSYKSINGIKCDIFSLGQLLFNIVVGKY